MKQRIDKSVSIPNFQHSIDVMNVSSMLFVDKSLQINQRIHDIMKRKNILQRDIANTLGKSEEEISKWLSGMHNFTLRSLTKLEIALGEPIIYCPQHIPQPKLIENEP